MLEEFDRLGRFMPAAKEPRAPVTERQNEKASDNRLSDSGSHSGTAYATKRLVLVVD